MKLFKKKKIKAIQKIKSNTLFVFDIDQYLFNRETRRKKQRSQA
jgi:hypothetical protein